MEEVEYPAHIRRRNRLTVGLFALSVTLGLPVASLLSDWPMKNALGLVALAIPLHCGLWWGFASKRAGKLVAPTSWKQWRQQFPPYV